MFRAALYRLTPPENVSMAPDVHVATVADLERLAPLLSDTDNHEARIESGDVCLFAILQGELAGIAWLNLHSHTDRHFGKWSRPTASAAYLNQFKMANSFLSGLIGEAFLRSALYVARERGLQYVHAVILRSDRSPRLLERYGGVKIGNMFAIRLGRVGTLRFKSKVDSDSQSQDD